MARKQKKIQESQEVNLTSQKVLSTGSTLLDLSISGLRFPEGGIPAGKVVELFGPSAGGKTAIACELSASCQFNGGTVRFRDPEGRMDKQYAEIYGMDWKNIEYDQPDTVEEALKLVDVDNTNICLDIIDSSAALSTELEMTKGDTMGMRRAKVFSTEFRKLCRRVSQQNRIVVLTNQIRQGQNMFGSTENTPGGNAIPFYSSLRMRVGEKSRIEKIVKVKGKDIKKIRGIVSAAYIKKNSIDSPYRECLIPIIFNYGVDDVRGNIEWLYANTDVLGTKVGYFMWEGKGYRLRPFVEFLEGEGLVDTIRQKVIQYWREIELQVRDERKPKVRR